MKRCPFCAEKMQDIAVVCPHCGRDFPQTGEMIEGEESVIIPPAMSSSRKTALILTGIVALVLVLASWGYFFYYAKAATQNITSMEATRSAQSVMLAQDQIAMTSIATTQQAFMGSETGGGNYLATVQAMRTQAAKIAATSTAEIAFARALSIKPCKPKITFDYTSNDTINAQLKEFVESIGGPTTEAKYELPWSVNYISVHKFKNKYVFWFIVYLKNDTNGLSNTIYWVENNCYVDKN